MHKRHIFSGTPIMTNTMPQPFSSSEVRHVRDGLVCVQRKACLEETTGGMGHRETPAGQRRAATERRTHFACFCFCCSFFSCFTDRHTYALVRPCLHLFLSWHVLLRFLTLSFALVGGSSLPPCGRRASPLGPGRAHTYGWTDDDGTYSFLKGLLATTHSLTLLSLSPSFQT